VRELVRDLQLSILEFKSEFNAHILNLGLTGGTSQIQNLGPFLTQMLELPVNRVACLQFFPNTLFEKNPQADAKLGLALGLAVEGLKKPRNPAINFMRGEFAKQNYQLQAFWEKWGKTVQVGIAALVVLFIYTNLRESFSLSLADRGQEVLKTQAKTVAHLSGKSASDAGIRKYIRENKKRAADLKTLSNVAGMNSALDILKKVTDATPAKSAVAIDVRKLDIAENQVTVEGYLASARDVNFLQQSLTNITADGRVTAKSSTLSPLANKTAFAFTFQVDRGIQKVTK
jgi:general secretion pathway protein L